MPKITNQDIQDLGFIREMFAKNDDISFQNMIDVVISEQASILEGRIGTSAYNDSSAPNAIYVKQSEKCLVAAEMVQRRINILLGNSVGAGKELDTTAPRKQRQDYLDQVYGNIKSDRPVLGLIEKIITGSSTDGQDFASGVLISDHFGDDV